MSLHIILAQHREDVNAIAVGRHVAAQLVNQGRISLMPLL